ncbi:DUF4347 domain-containing protein [Duganella sp. FT134W]|uniref:DUF4347 domain-containing protein n=1 Tax=Duganella margarita TaxID=2692170 RepID=A0A7X4H135_9BURK|nr:Ig-like domain-containing protein [Duganella margarita]MYM72781.1 DUF4347 domain-containing protein [Duganella margarita]
MKKNHPAAALHASPDGAASDQADAIGFDVFVHTGAPTAVGQAALPPAPDLQHLGIVAADAIAPAPGARVEVVFIEQNVSDLDGMLKAIGGGREVHVLDAAQDGLQQMAQILAGRSGIDAIHLVTHGADASLSLGSLTLKADNTDAHAADLQAIGRSMKDGGDIMLYGCNVAADANGAAWLDRLAIVTGADVAASSNLTGGAELGGDWTLEVSSGKIDTPSVVTPDQAKLYHAVLSLSDTVTFANSGNFVNLGGATANDDVIYRVNADPGYQLKIDGANSGVVNYGSPNIIANYAQGNETQVTMSFQAGQVFSIGYIRLTNLNNTMPDQNLVFRGYSASNQLIATNTYTLPADNSGAVSRLFTFTGMTDIATLKVSATTNSNTIQMLQIDVLDLSNIHLPVADTTPPTLAITSSASTLKIGETSTITFTFSEDPGSTFTWNGSVGDVTVTGGTLGAISGAGLTRTAIFTPTAATNGGSASISVTAGSYTDAAGNSGGAGSAVTISYDTQAPAVSAPVLPGGSDSGVSGSDAITNVVTPTLTGTAEAGATVKLYDSDGTTLLGTTVATGGAWSITSTTLGAGAHTLKATATDTAGNVSALSSALVVTIDTSAPTVAITSNVAALKIGETATITFTFSEDPGAGFTWNGSSGAVTVTGGTLGAISGTGLTRTATFTPTNGVDAGTASISVAASAYTDKAGNAGAAGIPLALSYDTLAPAAPSTPDLAAASDSGISSTDNITNITTPTFTGTATNGATVTLYDTNGSTVLGTTVATGGAWSIVSSTLAAGVHQITASVSDAAGNVSVSPSLSVDIATTPPTLAISSSAATLNGAQTAIITFTFSADPGASFTWDGTAGDVVVSGGTLGAISGSGLIRTAVFTPTAGVNSGSASITVPAGAYADAVNNSGGAGASPSISFDTLAPNTPAAPTLNSDSGASSSDGITNVVAPAFSGTAEANALVTLYDSDGTTVLGTTSANGSGNWSITSAALIAGAHSITVRQTDAAGNVSPASPAQHVTIDLAAPTAIALSATTASAGGAVAGAALATLSATDAQAISYSLVTGSAGNDASNALFTIVGSTLKPIANLALGTYQLYVSATDAAGNHAEQALTFTVNSGPSVTSIVRAAASATVPGADNSVVYSVTFSELVTGVDASDFSVHGTGASGTVASVVDSGDGIHYRVTVNGISGDGTLRLDLNASATGIQNGASSAIVGGYTSGQTYTIDRTAPAAPSMPVMTTATDTGASNADGVTSNTSPVFTGTGEIGSTVTLYDASNSNALIGSATVDGGGHYSITPSAPFTPGPHQLYVQASDAAANTSAHSANLAVVIDTAAPTAILLPTSTVYTSAGLNAVVGTLVATDVGGSGALTYQLVAGAGDTNNGNFTISNGVLTLNDPSAVGVATESIRIKVTDAAGNFYSQVLTVQVSAPPPPVTPVPTVDGVPVTTTPVTLPGGGSGTTVTIPVVTAGQGTTDGAANVADIPLVTASNSALLTAQVPVGTGLSATGGGSQPAGNSLDQLIAAIKAQTTTHDAADQSHLTGNGTQFLGLLQNDVPLLVSTITLSNVDAAISTPLTLTGTSAGNQHTALVIDTSALPGNANIALSHVNFAAVVGTATVTGDTAGQIITGDRSSQHVTISAGTASQIHAGGGSDVLQYGVSSAAAATHAAGAPQAAGLLSTALVPNSTTTGSLTAATSILLNGGTGADMASFGKAQSAYSIDQRDGYILVTDNSDATQRITVTNVESLQFKDGSVAVQSRDALTTIAGLYASVLGRQAEIAGFDFWGAAEASGVSLGSITVGILNSPESVARGHGLNGDVEHDINTLYQALFGRQSDATGFAFWKDAIAHGASITEVANGFVGSAEMVGHKLAATGWDLVF